jgi:hypothetical protein
VSHTVRPKRWDKTTPNSIGKWWNFRGFDGEIGLEIASMCGVNLELK